MLAGVAADGAELAGVAALGVELAGVAALGNTAAGGGGTSAACAGGGPSAARARHGNSNASRAVVGRGFAAGGGIAGSLGLLTAELGAATVLHLVVVSIRRGSRLATDEGRPGWMIITPSVWMAKSEQSGGEGGGGSCGSPTSSRRESVIITCDAPDGNPCSKSASATPWSAV